MNSGFQMAETTISINEKVIGSNYPTYFIADIAANHDGDLERAKDLIWKAKQAGADAAKFQHFNAESIVSDIGFRSLGSQKSHQSEWKKNVFEVYKDASLNIGWTPELKNTCDEAGIAFFTSPYEIGIVEEIDSYVPAYKIGSGDITWHELVEHIASKGKPYILATGASSMDEVDRAVQKGLAINKSLALLQCNTNYTGSLSNFKHIQLNVLRSYAVMYPDMVLGLSDHTPGHSCVLGAVALGARIIEKHFTDDNEREGPDHKFSMNPSEWREMVDRTRELELAMGNGIKRVEVNEIETAVVQRRSLRLRAGCKSGHVLERSDLIPLRPCPTDAFTPMDLPNILGKRIRIDKEEGDYISFSDIE